MKKIGVVTYAHCENFGAELQACALCHAIEQLPDAGKAEIVWFERTPLTVSERRKTFWRGIQSRLMRNPIGGFLEVFQLGINLVRSKISRPKEDERIDLERRHQAFETFWNEHEPHSPKVKPSEIASMRYDVLVAGSDQIWNWQLTGDISPYLLVLPGLPESVRKVSYAASLSVDKIDDRYMLLYRKGLSAFRLISVRETQGREVLKRIIPKPIEVVCDPTLLLDGADWRRYEDGRMHVDGDYVFVYTLNSSRRFWRKVVAFARVGGLKIVNLHGHAPRGIEVVDASSSGPADFLHLIRGAKAVITNSFHGTIFSINFKVPFVSVLNPVSEVNSRVLSIARLLGLEHRVLFDDEDTPLTDLKPIDYKAVDVRLAELRRLSWKFLTEAING